MTKIIETKQTRIHECADGAVTVDETTVTNKITQSDEPDYIKLYTQMWCDFNNIPRRWQPLFLELASNMTYANSQSPNGGQTICIYGAVGEAIRVSLGWSKQNFFNGIRALCDCGAIRKIGRAVYQINPSYAGRGQWKYNPRLDSGGIEDIVATFKFKERAVDTNIIYADDGTDATRDIRKNVGAGAVIKRTVTTPSAQATEEDDNIPGQMEITDMEAMT